MVKKAVRHGPNESGAEAYLSMYVEVPSDERTTLAVFPNTLLEDNGWKIGDRS